MHNTLPFQPTPRWRGQVWFLGPALPGLQGPYLSFLLPLPSLVKSIPSKGHLPPPSGHLGWRGCFMVHQRDQCAAGLPWTGNGLRRQHEKFPHVCYIFLRTLSM